MNMTYDGVLVMPSDYAVVHEDEMTYLDGGATRIGYHKASDTREKLDDIINLCYAGSISATVVGAGLGYLLGGVGAIPGAIFGFVAGDGWFGNVSKHAKNAHNQVEGIISRYGKEQRCKITMTTSTIHVTGLTVTKA